MADSVEFDINQVDLRFRYLPARKLTRRRYNDIRRLRFRHYTRELIDNKSEDEKRTPQEIGQFIGQTTLASMKNKNTLVSIGARTAGQRYARQGLVLVTDDKDNLRAGISIEDNVSSASLRKKDPSFLEKAKGNAELFAKLHLPITYKGEYLPDHRYFVFEEVLHDGTLPGIEHVLAGVALRTRRHRSDQGVSAWPFHEESGFRSNLTMWGLEQIPSPEPLEVQAFGQSAKPAELEQWKGPYLGSVLRYVFAVEGVPHTVDQVLSTMDR